MGRTPCCEKNGLKKGPWTPEEDQKLVDYIHKHGYGNWRTLPKNAGLQRCGKSCRLRWTNYLRPDIKRGRFSFEEEETIIHLHSILGNKWSAIASRLPGRTDNEIKNYWNTHIRKRLLRMGIDPVTHSPRLDLLDLSSLFGSSISHMNNNMQHPLHHLNPELLKLATSLFSQNNSLDSQNQIITDVSLPFPQVQFLESGNNVVDSSYPSNLHHDLMSSSDYWHANNNIGIVSTSSPCYVTDQLPTSYYYNNNSNNYYSHHASLVDPPMSETSTFHSNNSSSNNNISNNNNLVSVSTPSSSPKPLNSYSTTYVNGNNSSTEDERESYVSSNNSVLRFEIPDMLDVNAFV